jgi:hypothetical protein
VVRFTLRADTVDDRVHWIVDVQEIVISEPEVPARSQASKRDHRSIADRYGKYRFYVYRTSSESPHSDVGYLVLPLDTSKLSYLYRDLPHRLDLKNICSIPDCAM